MALELQIYVYSKSEDALLCTSNSENILLS